MTESTSAAPAAEIAAASRPVTGRSWLVVAIVCVAQLMDVLDTTIVNVALSSIQGSLGLSDGRLQWVVTAYALMFGGFLLLGGRLADRLGRKRILLAGVTILSLGSLLSGVAESDWALITGRGVQGLGAALITPAALSIVTTTFSDSGNRTKALGLWGAVTAGGGALGLLLGGVLTDLLSWHWVFLVNLPIGILCLAAIVWLVPESRDRAEGGFDFTGALVVTAGLMVLVYALVTRTWWLCAVGAALLVGFVALQRIVSAPLVRLSIFKVRTLSAANGVSLLSTSGIFAMFFFTSLYLQSIQGYSPMEGGLSFLAPTVGVMIGATVSQQLVRKFGPVPIGSTGMALGAVGMLVLARAPRDASYVVDLLPGLMPLSIGLGLAFVPLTLLATSGVPETDAGLASGLYSTVQQIGGALGLAVLSSVALARTTAALADPGVDDVAARLSGFSAAYLGGAVLLALGAVLFAVLVRRRHLSGLDLDSSGTPGA